MKICDCSECFRCLAPVVFSKLIMVVPTVAFSQPRDLKASAIGQLQASPLWPFLMCSLVTWMSILVAPLKVLDFSLQGNLMAAANFYRQLPGYTG